MQLTFIEVLDNYNALAYKMRGQVLNKCIDLELVIENFIADYYCPKTPTEDNIEKVRYFRKIFFEETRMMFTKKIALVIDLIRKYKPEFETFISHVVPLNRLNEIVKVRNKLAHVGLDFSLRGMDKKVKERYIHLKANYNTPSIKYSEKYIDKLVEDINFLTGAFLHATWLPVP